ncbi:MAG: DUF3943 domain-containing protein, partial [Elusimicrobiota bacterium]|nr:DUF3943 domain-containing protein [Elusimicrobiota bacterium]
NGFVWDNDNFSMNAFYHPYNGSLYFNAARANGLTFWQAIPFSFAGSLMWEFFGENSYPAINDFAATSIGGIALGEVTHRISRLVLDDSSRGYERAGREILAGIISPMDLLNRILTGEARRYSPIEKNDSREKFHINLSIFNRFMTDLDRNRDRSNTALGFTVLYGEPFSDKEHSPYDFFIADVNFNVIGDQPFINEASILGLLWGKQWEKEPRTALIGIFQNFDYYNSNSLIKDGQIPYEFAETASFGVGFYFKKQEDENNLPVFLGSLNANLLLLGASQSDYYSVYERDYNFGSGYSLKLGALVNFYKHFNAFVNLKTYWLYTLNNNEIEEYNSIHDEYSVRGNNSDEQFSILSAGLSYRITDDLIIIAEQRFFSRRTRYEHFEDISTNSMETRIKLTLSIFN